LVSTIIIILQNFLLRMRTTLFLSPLLLLLVIFFVTSCGAPNSPAPETVSGPVAIVEQTGDQQNDSQSFADPVNVTLLENTLFENRSENTSPENVSDSSILSDDRRDLVEFVYGGSSRLFAAQETGKIDIGSENVSITVLFLGSADGSPVAQLLIASKEENLTVTLHEREDAAVPGGWLFVRKIWLH